MAPVPESPHPTRGPVLPAPPSARPPWRTYRLAGWVGLAGWITTTLLAAWFRRDARIVDEARFRQACQVVGSALEHRVQATEAMLRDLARLLSGKSTPDEADWDEFMNQVAPQWNFPGVSAMGYATNVSGPATWEAMERWIREQGSGARTEFYRLPPGFRGEKVWRVWQLEVYPDDLHPGSVYSRVVPLGSIAKGGILPRRYSGPASIWDRRADEFRLGRSGDRERLMETISDTNQLSHAVLRDEVKITGRRFDLRRRDGAEPPMATLMVPTYTPRRAEFRRWLAPYPEEPWEPYWLRWHLNQGVVFAHLDFARLVEVAQGTGDQPIDVRVHAAAPHAVSAETCLNPGTSPRLGSASGSTRRPSFRLVHAWPMYGDRWTMILESTPLFDQQSTADRAAWAAGFGMAMTMLLAAILALQARARWRDQQRASDLVDARNALQAAQAYRERLSAELHDGAIQSLYAVQLGLGEASREVDRLSLATGASLRAARASLDAVITELRRFVSIGTSSFAQPGADGLRGALEAVASDLGATSPARVEVTCPPEAESSLEPRQAIELVGIARGAISNAVRHAGASRISLGVCLVPDAVLVQVDDDGHGFDLAQTPPGVGLRTMQARAQHLGAELRVVTGPGRGTRVEIRLPRPSPPPG